MGYALVFPGQGSQRPAMAGPWRDHPAFERWAQADEILRSDVTRLGLEADAAELKEPANCQVALFVHGAVLLDAWTGSDPDGNLTATAGHSLGEYDALIAAGVLDFADGLRLVDARARSTQTAADERPGTMVACLGFEVDEVRDACAEVGAHVANDNAPGQITAAGTAAALGRLKEALRASGEGRRVKVVDVEVGAAYHSPHMEPAVEPFGKALDDVRFREAGVPVVANVDAAVHTAAGDWPELLRRQLTSPVRWRETVETLPSLGVDKVVELSAAPVLTGLVKRTDRSLGRRTVSTPEDLEG